MYEDGNRRVSFNWLTLLIKLIILVVVVFLACWIFVRVLNNKNAESKKVSGTSAEYVSNMGAMKDAALEYFTTSKLPERIGETEKVTLGQMINQKLLIDFTDNGNACDVNSSYAQATKTADGNYALKVNLDCKDKSDFIITTIEKNTVVPTNSSTNNETNNSTNSNSSNSSNTNNSSNSNSSSSSSKSSSSSSSKSSSSKNSSSSTSNTTKTNTSKNSSSSSNTSKTTTSYIVVKNFYDYRISCSQCKTDVLVRFDSKGGSYVESQLVGYNNVATKPTNPIKEGYEFVEWQLNGQKFDFSTRIKEDITLVAVWKENTTRYYRLYRYTNWENGYSYELNAENRRNTVTTYNYCETTTRTYYSTSWVHNNETAHSYSYEMQLLDIDPYNTVQSTVGLVASSKNYFNENTNADYNAYVAEKRRFAVYMTGNTGVYDVEFTNANTFYNAALNRNNFTFSTTGVYLKEGTYRTTITINLKNTYGAYAYTSSNTNITTPVYFVPIKFDVEFANKNDCIRDTYENSSKYPERSISDPMTQEIWQHRFIEYKWSTSKNVSGWTFTGEYEDR